MEIRRPVFISGENPAGTLYKPGTEEPVAIASFWHCDIGPWGVGKALILWISPDKKSTALPEAGYVFTDNSAMAEGIVQSLAQYFDEFKDVSLMEFPYREAVLTKSFDGDVYQGLVKTKEAEIEILWKDLMDKKQLSYPDFPAGDQRYDLTNVLCPCRKASIRINGDYIPADPQTGTTAEGTQGSSAFLAFGETWVGPLKP